MPHCTLRWGTEGFTAGAPHTHKQNIPSLSFSHHFCFLKHDTQTWRLLEPRVLAILSESAPTDPYFCLINMKWAQLGGSLMLGLTPRHGSNWNEQQLGLPYWGLPSAIRGDLRAWLCVCVINFRCPHTSTSTFNHTLILIHTTNTSKDTYWMKQPVRVAHRRATHSSAMHHQHLHLTDQRLLINNLSWH